jgi:hypothetical protein
MNVASGFSYSRQLVHTRVWGTPIFRLNVEDTTMIKRILWGIFHSFHIDYDSEPIQSETIFYFLSLLEMLYAKLLKLQHNAFI